MTTTATLTNTVRIGETSLPLSRSFITLAWGDLVEITETATEKDLRFWGEEEPELAYEATSAKRTKVTREAIANPESAPWTPCSIPPNEARRTLALVCDAEVYDAAASIDPNLALAALVESRGDVSGILANAAFEVEDSGDGILHVKTSGDGRPLRYGTTTKNIYDIITEYLGGANFLVVKHT